jgi:hypothetical protein
MNPQDAVVAENERPAHLELAAYICIPRNMTFSLASHRYKKCDATNLANIHPAFETWKSVVSIAFSVPNTDLKLFIVLPAS